MRLMGHNRHAKNVKATLKRYLKIKGKTTLAWKGLSSNTNLSFIE